ncbi:alpha/beta hydrolase family protein [Saccharibacillus alkalitolerans]|uniref:S9 family peptidase n=1 Tax=Saccharibacillus alkalitolerans TaxID=2705290 RepID=A0ABX0FA02_9BACL|nr:prolyl oligopeptidase family serine peptidase [Saccharibacillus alkalitolerans]NGZ77761.1 S9 family peptidase [Saccharibacillus alkalitolerans]
MIYRITYLSDGLRVAGYVALPPGLETTEEELAAFLRRECGDDGLTAAAAACILPAAAEAAKRAAGEAPDYAPEEYAAAGTEKPAFSNKAPYPVLVYCRGGIGRVGRVQLDWLAEFASFGHIVMAPCYRGGESGVGHDRFGGADLEDSRVAVRLAKALPWADPERLAVMGFSRGSVNATDAAVHERASRLVLLGGLSDLAQTYEERVDLRRMLKRVVGGSAYKLPEVYRDRSPIHMAREIECPVLIIHGTQDAQVDYGHGERMYEELLRRNKPASLARLEGFGHHMSHAARMIVLAGMFRWLETEIPAPRS